MNIILDKDTTEFILQAPNKALATFGPQGINVVPVSTIRIVEDKILLVNYFMNKTIENIKNNPDISLVCWSGLDGYQIKGEIEYKTSGELFDELTAWAIEKFPEREVHGILLVTPQHIYPISAKT